MEGKYLTVLFWLKYMEVKLEFEHVREHIGNINQVFSVKEYILTGGRKQGVRGIDVSNGAGIDITILPDRGMDIYQLKYKGKCLNYLATPGILSPEFYDAQGTGWLRSFYGGFLTTCGLENIGSATEDKGVQYGLHGSISNTPAEFVNIIHEEKDGIPVLKISGTMIRACQSGDNLKLTRTYEFQYGSKDFTFYDEIENFGYKKSPFMILYHMNMGYPLLSEKSELILPTNQVTSRTEHAKNHADKYKEITYPADGYEEMCYYHDIVEDENGLATVGIKNSSEEIGVKITYDKKILDHFIQWKMLGKGEYVMGLEPCNATIDGRMDAKENGSLKFIDAGEKIGHKIKISMM